MKSFLYRSAMAAFAFGALGSTSGCAASADDAASGSAAVVGPEGSKDPSVPSEPAGGPRIESVRANGTGCRGDAAYSAEIAPDGKSVIVSLATQEVSVARGEAFALADCVISLRIADAAGHRYAIASFEGAGYASLHGTDMKSTETVTYSIQGDALASTSRAKELVGAVGGHRYTFGDAFGDDAVWSPCGGGRDVNVTDGIVLRNNPEKTGYGYVGAWTLKLALASRACDVEQPANDY